MRYFIATLITTLACLGGRADKLVLVAGGGEGLDGTNAETANLIQPFGVDFAKDGTIYIVEMAKGERLRAITPKGKLITLAGSEGVLGSLGDGGPGLKATFNGMHSLAVSSEGTVYLADTWKNRIRKFDPKTGIVSTFAGTGEKGFSGDGGPAVEAEFGGCFCVALDPTNKIVVITDLD